MVCTGRAPYSDDLGLGDINVQVNRGFVQVSGIWDTVLHSRKNLDLVFEF